MELKDYIAAIVESVSVNAKNTVIVDFDVSIGIMKDGKLYVTVQDCAAARIKFSVPVRAKS